MSYKKLQDAIREEEQAYIAWIKVPSADDDAWELYKARWERAAELRWKLVNRKERYPWLFINWEENRQVWYFRYQVLIGLLRFVLGGTVLIMLLGALVFFSLKLAERLWDYLCALSM